MTLDFETIKVLGTALLTCMGTGFGIWFGRRKQGAEADLLEAQADEVKQKTSLSRAEEIRYLTTEIRLYRSEQTKIESRVLELTRLLAESHMDYDKRFLELKRQHTAEIAAVTTRYEDGIRDTAQKHEERITSMETRHAEEIRLLIETYEARIKTLEERIAELSERFGKAGKELQGNGG